MQDSLNKNGTKPGGFNLSGFGVISFLSFEWFAHGDTIPLLQTNCSNSFLESVAQTFMGGLNVECTYSKIHI